MTTEKLKTTALILLSVLIVTACEKVIEPKDLPEQDPRIVVNCILHPDSVIKANISSSKSIISGKDYKLIENANCILYEDNALFEKLVHQNNGVYFGTKKPQGNKLYTLKVSAPGYKEVEGSCYTESATYVSKIQRYDSVNYNFMMHDYGGGGGYYIGGLTKFKVWINDDVKARNYYSLQVAALLFDSNGDTLHGLEANISLLNNNNESGTGSYYGFGNTITTNDAYLVNGNQVLLDLDLNLYHSGSGTSSLPDIAYTELYFQVSALSDDLYRYMETANLQATSGGINLFAEPVLVHNNIKNGMGIVGSITPDIKRKYRVEMTGR